MATAKVIVIQRLLGDEFGQGGATIRAGGEGIETHDVRISIN